MNGGKDVLHYLGNIVLYGSTLALSWEGVCECVLFPPLTMDYANNVFPWGVRCVRIYGESSWRWWGMIDEERWRWGEQKCQESDVSFPFLKTALTIFDINIAYIPQISTVAFNVRCKNTDLLIHVLLHTFADSYQLHNCPIRQTNNINLPL